MRNLLAAQLRLVVPILLLTNGALITAIFFFYPEMAISLPVIGGIGPCAAFYGLRRSEWYLSLPWSRGKLAAQMFLESLSIILVGSLTTCLAFFLLRDQFTNEWSVRLYFGGVLGFDVFLLALSMAYPMTGRPIRRDGVARWAPSKIALLFGCSILAFAFLQLLMDYASYFGFVVFFCALSVFFILSLCGQIVVPSASLRRARAWVVSFGLLVSIVPLVASLFIIHLGAADSLWIPNAFSFLDRLAGHVSPERAWALFESPGTPASPAFTQVLNLARTSIGFEQWKKRTLDCKTRECLALSADFAQPSTMESADLARRFSVIVDVCRLDSKNKKGIRCSGPWLDRHRLREWNHQLVEFGVADEWLRDEDPVKQIFGIRMAESKVTEARERQIKGLISSSDVRVHVTAKLAVARISLRRVSGADCSTDKNKYRSECFELDSPLADF